MRTPIPSRLGKSVAMFAAGLTLAATASALPLLEETFPTGERTTQNLPQTSAWYTCTSTSILDYSAGSLGLNVGTGNGFVISYFTDGTPVSLATGESLSIEFDFQVTGAKNAGGGIRIGIFNSGGNRVSGDGGGDSQSAFFNYTGYATHVNPAATTSSPLSFRQRLSGESNALIQSTAAYSSAMAYGGAKENTLTDNTTYTGKYTLERTAEGEMTITMSITGENIDDLLLTRADTSGIDTLFDTFVFSAQNGAVSSFTLKDVDVTYNQIPEAGTTGLLMGIGAASLLLWRRRRFVPAARRVLLWSVVFFAGGAAASASWQSELVSISPDGTLQYESDEEGNRIPDFSHAGYHGGGVPLPEAPVVKTLGPVEGDNTARIQEALDEVGRLPLDPATGLRGALMLEPGVYEVSDTLYIRQSGVVLLGYGQGDDPVADTILRRTGTERGPVILAGASGQAKRFASAGAGTPDRHCHAPGLPVGSDSFEVGRCQRLFGGRYDHDRAPGDAGLVRCDRRWGYRLRPDLGREHKRF